MHASGSTVSKAIVLAFAGVVTAFVVGSGYTLLRAREIWHEALSIESNAAPSITHLSAARAEMRRLQFLVDDYVDNAVAGQAGPPDRLEGARATIDRHVASYLALPSYENEGAVWHAAARSLGRLDGLLDDIERLVREGEPTLAHARLPELHELADEAARRLADATEVNATWVGRLADRIRRAYLHAVWLGLGLDAVGVLLAALAAAVALRLYRTHTRLMDDYNQLTDRRATELEQFASRVAHDVLNPLSAAVLRLAAVRRGHLDDGQNRAVSQAQMALDQVRVLVGDLLAFARSGAQPQPSEQSSLRDIVEETCAVARTMTEDSTIEIVTRDLPGVEVACSRGALTSVVSNLVSNAMKFVRGQPVQRVDLRARLEEGIVTVEIEDTGPGLPRDMNPDRLFDPYVRGPGVTQPGLGLGLATVKRIVEAHGGRVGARRAASGGAIFWFALPRRKESAAAGRAQPAITR